MPFAGSCRVKSQVEREALPLLKPFRGNLRSFIRGMRFLPTATAKAASRRPFASAPARLVRRAFAFNLTRFLVVGTAGLVTDTLLFSVLSAGGLSDAAARALSLIAATGVTWRLNRRFTFGQSERRQGSEGGLYAAVAFCAQGLNYAIFLTLRGMAPMLPAIGAILVSAACAAVFSYSGQRFITFRGQIRA